MAGKLNLKSSYFWVGYLTTSGGTCFSRHHVYLIGIFKYLEDTNKMFQCIQPPSRLSFGPCLLKASPIHPITSCHLFKENLLVCRCLTVEYLLCHT